MSAFKSSVVKSLRCDEISIDYHITVLLQSDTSESRLIFDGVYQFGGLFSADHPIGFSGCLISSNDNKLAAISVSGC